MPDAVGGKRAGGRVERLGGARRRVGFDVIRSDAHGRYHAGYRFKFLGPGDWQLRVLSEAEADFPFARGASNVVGVRVL